MIDGYAVDCQALTVHAGEVEQVADQLEKAAAVAQPVSSAAFGLVGRAFADSLITAGTAASAAITGLARAARADRAGLHSTVEAYRCQEVEQGRAFDGVHATGGPR